MAEVAGTRLSLAPLKAPPPPEFYSATVKIAASKFMSLLGRKIGPSISRRTSMATEVRRAQKQAAAEEQDITEKKRLIAQQEIPLDLLATEWLQGANSLDAKDRGYFVEQLLPTLILGLEKVVRAVEKAGLAEETELNGRLNPINLLAQHLMRNNPRYSNFAEASPYMMSLRLIQDKLKAKAKDMSNKRKSILSARARSARDEALKDLDSEADEFRQSLIEQIPDLWAAAAEWEGIKGSGVNHRMLLGAFRSFELWLKENRPVDAMRDIFESLPENLSDIAVEARLAGDRLLLKLGEWSEKLRTLPNADEVMRLLVVHVTSKFENSVSQGYSVAMNMGINSIFRKCDVNREGVVDRGLVVRTINDYLANAPEEIRAMAPAFDRGRDKTSHLTQSINSELVEIGEDVGGEYQELVIDPRDSPKSVVISQLMDDGGDVFDESRPLTPLTPLFSGCNPLDPSSSEGSCSVRAAARRNSSVIDAIQMRDLILKYTDPSLDTQEFLELLVDSLGEENMTDDAVLSSLGASLCSAFEKESVRLVGEYRKKAEQESRMKALDGLFERLDVDCSGFIEEDELVPILEHWQHMSPDDALSTAHEVMVAAGPEDDTGLLRLSKPRFAKIIGGRFFDMSNHESFELNFKRLDRVLDSVLPDQERYEARRAWLSDVEATGSFACFTDCQPAYEKAFEVIAADARRFPEEGEAPLEVQASVHTAVYSEDRTSVVSLVIASGSSARIGDEIGDMNHPAFTVVNTGLSKHIASIASEGDSMASYDCSVEKDGEALLCPIQDPYLLTVPHNIVGLLAVDNVAQSHRGEATKFVPHYQRFVQGVARTLSDVQRNITNKKKLVEIAVQLELWVMQHHKHITAVRWYVVSCNPDDPGSMAMRMYVANKRSGSPVSMSAASTTVLIRCYELNGVVSSKRGKNRATVFPIAIQGKVMMLAEVITKGPDKLSAVAERGISRMMAELTTVHSVIKLRDVEPPAGEYAGLASACIWHKATFAVDKVVGVIPYYLRFRILGLRKDFEALRKVVFTNMKMIDNPSKELQLVLSLSVLAFLGDEHENEVAKWGHIRRYLTPDIKRAVLSYDPTVPTFLNTLMFIERKLIATQTQRWMIAETRQDLCLVLYDWLRTCIALARFAAAARGQDIPRSSEEEENAAIAIQAGFRGYRIRKQGRNAAARKQGQKEEEEVPPDTANEIANDILSTELDNNDTQNSDRVEMSPLEKIAANVMSNPENLACKNFDIEYYESLDEASKAGLLKCMASGIENVNSGMGCYANQPSDYETFKPFFKKVLSQYHKVDEDAKHINSWDLSSVEGLPDDGLLDLAALGLPELSMRVRVGRNLKDFPLPGAMTKDDRIAMEMKMVAAFDILKADPAFGGLYHSLTPGHPDFRNAEEYQKLVDDHVMFKDMAADAYLVSAGISSDWPYGRGCYQSEDKAFIIWVGEEDHLRIMCMYKGTVLNGVFNRLKAALDVVSSIPGLEFAFSEQYGVVTSCPTNLGTGMRASVHIPLPNLTADGSDARAKAIAKPLGLSVRGTGGEHTSIGKDGTCDISPSARFCITEAQIITSLYKGLKLLKEEEEKAGAGEPTSVDSTSVEAPQAAESDVSASIDNDALTNKADSIASTEASVVDGVNSNEATASGE